MFCEGIPYFTMYNADPCFWLKLSGKIFHFKFLIQYFIHLYLDTCVLYFEGILALIFEHIMVQEILCNK